MQIENKFIIIIDGQFDFVRGRLGSEEAVKVVPNIIRFLDSEISNDPDVRIYFTKDTHNSDYLGTLEGKYLPVEHTIINTPGWELIDELKKYEERIRSTTFYKPTFGYTGWMYVGSSSGRGQRYDILGFDTDICVISNALIIRAMHPEAEIYVHEDCCAGTTPDRHKAAIEVMRSCQIHIMRNGKEV